jgi:hypothetical protein
MPTDELQLKADFSIGDVWHLADPDEFRVVKEDPPTWSMGGDVMEYLTAEALSQTVAIVYALRDSGLLDWIRKKSFDVLWDYLKVAAATMPGALGRRAATFELKDENGVTRFKARFPRFDPGAVDQARFQIKEAIASGVQKRELVIEIKSRKHR